MSTTAATICCVRVNNESKYNQTVISVKGGFATLYFRFIKHDRADFIKLTFIN